LSPEAIRMGRSAPKLNDLDLLPRCFDPEISNHPAGQNFRQARTYTRPAQNKLILAFAVPSNLCLIQGDSFGHS
jgi:hypothetical protein